MTAPPSAPGHNVSTEHPAEVGARFAAFDWSLTPLGPISTWPSELRGAVSICLTSRFPMLIWWGSEYVMIYNDGYRPMLGTKHPQALGSPGKDVWPEIWDSVGPMLDSVMNSGVATWSRDQKLMLERQWLPRGDLLHLLVQPDHRELRRGGRCLHGRGGDDGKRPQRAPPRHPRRAVAAPRRSLRCRRRPPPRHVRAHVQPAGPPLAVMVDARALPEDLRDLGFRIPYDPTSTQQRRRRSPRDARCTTTCPRPSTSRTTPPDSPICGTARSADHVAGRRRDVERSSCSGARRTGNGIRLSRRLRRPLCHPSRDALSDIRALDTERQRAETAEALDDSQECLLHQPQSRAAHAAHLDRRSDL